MKSRSRRRKAGDMPIVDGRRREVVVVGSNDVAGMLKPGPQGVYVVGTGRTGVAETFCVLGAVYFVVMVVAAFSYRIPAPGLAADAAGFQPRNTGWKPVVHGSMISQHNVDVNEALRTPQFYLLWLMLCLNVTAGIGVLAVAKTMLTELFGTTLPQIVDNNFARTYVLATSVFNMLGRFFWASASDYLGRQRTYTIFFALGSVLYLSIPFTAHQVSVSPSVTWLVDFYAVSMMIFTMYGGGFATIPAYLADLFGTRYVGGIHGRLLTAWSVAGVLGPEAINLLRAASGASGPFAGSATVVDPAQFAERFGAAAGAARSARGAKDGHHCPADGAGAQRHDRSHQHALQQHDVPDGRPVGRRPDCQCSRPSGRRAPSPD